MVLDLNEAFEKFISFSKQNKVVIHQEAGKVPYITINDDPNGDDIRYCATCFGYEGKFIPLYKQYYCNICKTRGHK